MKVAIRRLGSVALAQVPDLLERIVLGPVRRHAAPGPPGIRRGVDFAVVLDLEPDLAKEGEPAFNGQVEADAARVDLYLCPIGPAKITVRAVQAVRSPPRSPECR